ncbi:MAG: phytoene/squalene synthase family protein [Balneolaceae bacterium]
MNRAINHNLAIYDRVSKRSSRLVTRSYSTSFSIGINLLDNSIRDAIYAIYGFVRLGDEIVDTFVMQDREELLKAYREETHLALARGISLNPVLHQFQKIANRFQIDRELVDAFFQSMEMDLLSKHYKKECYNQYIYGSAEVVGLMCLKVFCDGDETRYKKLVEPARKLGSAFQKVNFLRDIRQDREELGRFYFPNLGDRKLDIETKNRIVAEIEEEFTVAREGISQLPTKARAGVTVAYTYYRQLLAQLKCTPPDKIHRMRIRISTPMKCYLLVKTLFRHSLNRI